MYAENHRIEALGLLQSLLGYHFDSPDLLTTALTHPSFAFEQGRDARCCERLAFLGDATLNLIVSRCLSERLPDHTTGDLTKLRAAIVSNNSLARMAREIHLGESILLGKGEEQNGGRDKPSILAGRLEALIAAIYLEAGVEKAADIFLQRCGKTIDEIISANGSRDPKSDLQEFTQRELGCMPVYQIVSETGPEHQKTFKAALNINGQIYSYGAGRSKKEAEQEAAIAALEILQQENHAFQEHCLKAVRQQIPALKDCPHTRQADTGAIP